MNLDEDLWEKAKTSHFEPECILWFFSLDTPEKISILNYKSSRVLLVTRRAFLELAVFDTIAAFWESLPKPLHEATRILISYHKLLRKEVTDDLLTQAPDGLTKCPPLLHPWLRRTLCLLGHDECARRVFETFKYPTHLLEEVFLKIIDKGKFQEILLRCFSKVVGKHFFCWKGVRRSWELFHMFEATGSHEFQAKGIFILPHEAEMETWALISTVGSPETTSRNYSGVHVHYSDYRRLVEKQWLNDEIINAYTALMDNRDGITVLKTYFWNSITEGILPKIKRHLTPGQKDSRGIQEVINSFRKVIFPVNWNTDHWLAVILFPEAQEIEVLDSYSCYTADGQRELVEKIKEELELPESWSTKFNPTIPQQQNGYDCGVFCSQFMKVQYFGGAIPDWSSIEVEQLRKMMVLELYEMKLRWHQGRQEMNHISNL